MKRASNKPNQTIDLLNGPLALLAKLSSKEIAERIDQLEDECAALRVLHRSARARETRNRREDYPKGQDNLANVD